MVFLTVCLPLNYTRFIVPLLLALWCGFANISYAQNNIFSGSAGGSVTNLENIALPTEGEEGLRVPDQLDISVDPVTERLYEDPLITLRFAVIGLEETSNYYVVQHAVVRVLLAYNNFVDAVEETSRINDVLWRAKAFILLGEYEYMSGRRMSALSFYKQVLRLLSDYSNDGQEVYVLQELVGKFNIIGETELAAQTINVIQDINVRFKELYKFVEALIATGDTQYDDNINDLTNNLFELIRNNLNDNKQIEVTTIQTLNDIANLIAERGFKDRINDIYTHIIKRMLRREDLNSKLILALALSGRIYVGETRNVMSQVQSFPTSLVRALAFASVARSRQERGDAFGVLPLFSVALEEAKKIIDFKKRDFVMAWIAQQYAATRNLQYALEVIPKISNLSLRFNTVVKIAQTAFDNEQYRELLNLIDFIPFVGIRANIMIAVASKISDNETSIEQMRALLRFSLQETKAKRLPKYLLKGLQKILAAQLQFGDIRDDDVILNRVKALIEDVNNPSNKVMIYIQIARFLALRDRVQEAKIITERALEVTFSDDNKLEKAVSLGEIARVKLVFNDLIEAFDQASRIPATQYDKNLQLTKEGYFKSPKVLALIEVAEAIALTGDIELAIRAARETPGVIEHTIIIAEVAIAYKSFLIQQDYENGDIDDLPDLNYLRNNLVNPHSYDVDFSRIDYGTITL